MAGEKQQLEKEGDDRRGSLSGKSKAGRGKIWLTIFAVLVISALAVLFLKVPETPLERAIRLIKTNKAAAALPVLEEMSQQQPDNHLYLPWLAQCYLSCDRLAEARGALDTALKLKLPCDTIIPITKSFSKYYQQRLDYAEAERLLLSTQMTCPSADFSEDRKELYGSWAEMEARNGEITGAISHLEALVSMEGGHVPERIRHSMAELYRQKAAVEEAENGNDRNAIKLLEKSLSVADEPASRMALANLYTKNEQLQNAVEQYKEVSKKDSNNLEARRRLIELSVKLEDYRGAQEAALDLAERERCVENFQLLSSISCKLNNYAGAVRALEEASSLAPKDMDLLKELETTLNVWALDLSRKGKQDESHGVKARAERVAETIKILAKELYPDAKTSEQNPQTLQQTSGPSISLTASRIWLSKGSLTPEGEIKMKNTGSEALSNLALTVTFYDKTTKKRSGSVTVAAAGENHPMLPGQSRILYFSSPNIVRGEHQLSVLIYWKGKLIRELPVVKER